MISAIAGLLVPLFQAYLLFRIWREVKIAAEAERSRAELKDMVQKFGQMFASASEMPVPRPPKTRKVASPNTE